MGSGHTHPAPLKHGFLGRLDARAKLLTIIPAIVLVNLMRPGRQAIVFVVAGVFAALFVVAGHGAIATLKRGVCLLPFVVFVVVTLPFAAAGNEVFGINLGFSQLVATDEGLARAASVGMGALTSILGVLLLSGTTEGPEIFKGLRALGVPKAFVAVIAVVYRYLFEIALDAARLRRAAAARGFEATSLRAMPRLSAMAGALLVRSVSRSENVHYAMLARGFDGEVRTIGETRFGMREALFMAAFYGAVAGGILLVIHA
jgi:cobalt/nickel transport system permease protein